MKRSGPLARTAPLARVGWGRRESLVANRQSGRPRPRDTGPPERVRKLVRARSCGRCEWPGCGSLAQDMHHRLNRKDGGRHGEMRARLNGAAWLAHCCRYHHDLVTNPVGVDRCYAEASGWLLREGLDARVVPILVGHSPCLIVFDDSGGWQPVSDSGGDG